MRILLTGATGFIGGRLWERLVEVGHEVMPIVRKPIGFPHILWKDPSTALSPNSVAGFDAVVNLAGGNIATGRWTQKRKDELIRSRVDRTAGLATALIASGAPPKVWVGASAIGYYGERGDEVLTEASAMGTGFLAELCDRWEAAARPLENAGVRCCHARFGVVLDPSGGALQFMLPVFKLWMGGRLGPGTQWMSWITRDDVIHVLEFLLTNADRRGAFNAVAPNPVTNTEFTQTLAQTLRVKAIFPAPSLALRLAYGEIADAILLGSARVLPERLQAAGFRFQDANLAAAFARMLGR